MAEKEYIERDALIESLQKIESELAYAEGKEGYLFAYGALTGVRKSIIYTKSVPAADVVEVIRCKDCPHLIKEFVEEEMSYGFTDYREVFGCGRILELTGEWVDVFLDDFCSYRERKEG